MHWYWLTTEGKTALEASEWFADGLVTQDELLAARTTARVAAKRNHSSAQYFAINAAALDEQWGVGRNLGGGQADPETQRDEIRLMLNLVGPLPFRPIPFDASGRTTAVLSLAQSIYDERRFDRLPELATALEQEGCDCSELLEHLRSPGPHYLGTWSLDVVLGKQ